VKAWAVKAWAAGLAVVVVIGLAGDVVKSTDPPHAQHAPGVNPTTTLEAREIDHEEHGSPPSDGPRKPFDLAGATDTLTNADLLIYRDREGARREATLDHSGVATAVAVLMLVAFALAEAVGRRRQPLGLPLNFVVTSPLHRA
jgi:hypothetical protein